MTIPVSENRKKPSADHVRSALPDILLDLLDHIQAAEDPSMKLLLDSLISFSICVLGCGASPEAVFSIDVTSFLRWDSRNLSPTLTPAARPRTERRTRR